MRCGPWPSPWRFALAGRPEGCCEDSYDKAVSRWIVRKSRLARGIDGKLCRRTEIAEGVWDCYSFFPGFDTGSHDWVSILTYSVGGGV